MKNKEHSLLVDTLNYKISTINVLYGYIELTKSEITELILYLQKVPSSDCLRITKQEKVDDLNKYRQKLKDTENDIRVIRQQIKDCQRANNKAFIEYNNNKQKERLKVMNIDIQDNNKSKVVTLKQIIDSKQ